MFRICRKLHLSSYIYVNNHEVCSKEGSIVTICNNNLYVVYICRIRSLLRGLVCRGLVCREFTLGARRVGVGPSHEATSPCLSVCSTCLRWLSSRYGYLNSGRTS